MINLNYKQVKDISDLKSKLNYYLLTHTNIALWENVEEINTLDKINIIYENQMDSMNIEIIDFILFYLIEKYKEKENFIQYFKHIKIMNTF